MSTSPLLINGRPARLHGSLGSPDFGALRVLCSDPFDFVALWLRRKKQKHACVYWEQARQFYNAAIALPNTSSPLPFYYAFLNATKALLSAHSHPFSEMHGVDGSPEGGRASLANEIIHFKSRGVLAALANYLGEPTNAETDATLKHVLWHMPFIHRAYCLTFASAQELFIPLRDVGFVRKDRSSSAWVQATIDRRYVNAATRDSIGSDFELYKEPTGIYTLRHKRRFKWNGRELGDSLRRLSTYHRKVRARIVPIYASENRWYLRKVSDKQPLLSNSRLFLIYAAMHRLSELSRYDPVGLRNHFTAQHNWLLSEFIRSAPGQFIYGIASEITGLEFIRPDRF